jgi:hypothetical protein
MVFGFSVPSFDGLAWQIAGSSSRVTEFKHVAH